MMPVPRRLLKVESNGGCEEVWTRGDRKSQLKDSEEPLDPALSLVQSPPLSLQGNTGPHTEA